jgi:hypothetical protein
MISASRSLRLAGPSPVPGAMPALRSPAMWSKSDPPLAVKPTNHTNRDENVMLLPGMAMLGSY